MSMSVGSLLRKQYLLKTNIFYPLIRTSTQQPTSCLTVFDHFVGLALKGLMDEYMTRVSSIRTAKRI